MRTPVVSVRACGTRCQAASSVRNAAARVVPVAVSEPWAGSTQTSVTVTVPITYPSRTAGGAAVKVTATAARTGAAGASGIDETMGGAVEVVVAGAGRSPVGTGDAGAWQ